MRTLLSFFVAFGVVIASSFAAPAGWTSVDLGTATGGSASLSNGIYTVNGAGADIWGVSDHGQFLYQTLTGDGTIIARVDSIQNTNPWAKAGVMIRSGLLADSVNAAMLLSYSNGYNFQSRANQGATTVGSPASGYAAPNWVKLQRAGAVFTGYRSTDGVNWIPVSNRTITMPAQIYIGLAVTSHTNSTSLNQSNFSNVTVTPGVSPPGATGVLSPFAWGPVVAGTADHFINAFNVQPTWNGTSPVAASSSNGGHYITAAWDNLKTVYIDLGAGWRTWRIQQTWTQYIVGRGGSGVPFTSVWWDNSINNAPGANSITETQINFASQAHDATGSWVRDGLFATAITPKGRYLMLRTGYPTDHALEYAFIGYRDYSGANYAPEVTAGSSQSVFGTAHLQGTVTDDGIPNPPGAVTLAWTKVSGPGAVTFTPPNAIVTDATVTAAGSYQFRLTANDNGSAGLSGSATVNVTFAHGEVVPTLPEVKAFDYSTMTLIDEIHCGNPSDPHQSGMVEWPAGTSSYQTILGRSCRVLANPIGAQSRYFAYKVGAGKGLQAGQAYVLVVEYPEDKPRQTIVLNRGCETTRSFHTGITIGDALSNPYTPSNPNSMHFALSQQYRSSEMLFHLHETYPEIMQPRDDTEYDTAPRSGSPEEGFYVMIAHFSRANSPRSEGAAVARIALYAAPTLANYTQPLRLPPGNLPKRHLFWREEMSDDALNGFDPEIPEKEIDWYEWKARTAKFLGMNTFTTDLLEFGFNQGWSSAKHGGKFGPGNKWEQILYRLHQPQPALGLPNGYALSVLPYYEYAGSNSGGNGSLGPLRASRPLVGVNNGRDYTAIWWAERMNVDITETRLGTDANGINHPYTDVQQMLDCTITDLNGSDGGRPLLIAQKHNLMDSGGHGWGYVDFGPNYANYRITQTWTRSNTFASDPATPFVAAYWNNSYTGFTGPDVPIPAGSIAEPNINFITQDLFGGDSTWKRDMNRPANSPVTPAGRYLLLKAGPSISRCAQFLFVGWISGSGSTALRTLPISGAGRPTTNWPHVNLGAMFNRQPPFNIYPVDFVGAWFRTRPSQIPISFADAALARFATEANGGVAVTRPQLQASAGLRTAYINWWMGKRKAFLGHIRDYLRASKPSSVLLYTWDATEEGAHPVSGTGLIADDPGIWTGLVSPLTDYSVAISSQLQLNSMLTPRPILGSGASQEEYCYSMPWPDPANYQNSSGIMLTHTFNKPYTAADPNSWNAFRTQSGVAAIRHYCLNEDAMPSPGNNHREVLGYFVTDVDPAGPYVMLSEARAVAAGDPFYLGYLASNNFTRCSPGYVRNFNANYLALPAMASTVVAGAANATDVVVRKIPTTNGTYVAVINTSLDEKLNVQVTPPASGTVYDAVTEQAYPLNGGKIVLSMWPGQLKTFRIQ